MLEKIGKYEIRMQVGRGAMRIVYEGYDPVIGRRVAIKTLRTEMFEARQLPEVLARFKREAQSAGRLSHPHIVTIHDYGEHEGTAHIVMEYIKGNELGHELNRGVRYPLEDTVRIMIQLLGALAHAHENKVVHRDLKPANMFLLKKEEKKKADFAAEKEAEAKVQAESAKKAEGDRRATQRAGTVFQDCPDCPRMVVIPAGNFTMGSPASEAWRDNDEGPQHPVVNQRPFAAGRYEVTFDGWDACFRENGCGHNPEDAGWGRGRRPVINVSWRDAKQYAEWLSRKTGKRYRLLTEAEWEYAARAGTATKYSAGETISLSQANFGARQTVPVGSFGPNAFGLFDVHGNVWEWTEDCWNASYNGAPADGSAWLGSDCALRVIRGGSWDNNPRGVRSASRYRVATGDRNNINGFRLARTLERAE